MKDPVHQPVAIVTGSAKNIGRSIAITLARSGVRVIVHAKTSAQACQDTVKAIQDLGGQAHAVLSDISTPEGAQLLIDQCITHFGQLDMLINNAAIRKHTPFESLLYAEWREVTATILDSAYLCSHAAAPHLKKSSCASIVNFGGMSAHTGSKERAHVLAAKMGLIGLTRGLASDLGEHAITVNCIVPGLIDTERGESAGKGLPEHHQKNKTLVGRKGHPQEIADYVLFLCSDKARYVTGQSIHINGGAYLS
jgi:3-oxoacyl-[acyl-carrier protein] reductase